MRKKNRNRVPTDVAILQAMLDGEAYGLEISQRLHDRTNGAVQVGQSALYPALWKLEKEGYLESRESEPMKDRRGRTRVYYQLTAPGMRRAHEDTQVHANLFGLVPAVAPGGLS